MEKAKSLVLNADQKNITMNEMPITKRFVGPHQITVLRDTGCSSVVIKKQFVEPNQYTGTYGFMLMADRTVRKVPHARIEIHTPYYMGNVKAVCLTDALYDLLIGNIEGAREPSNPDPMWSIIN